MIVYSLCDYTGNMVKPWADAGYECVCFDTQHSIRADRAEGNITYRYADVRSMTPDDIPDALMIFAFPPCTHLAVSGARDFEKKGLRQFIDGLEIVESCRLLCQYSGAPWMLENPVSRLSSAWRKPDHYFHPWQYGDGYTKKTCLWTGGGFVMPEPTTKEKPDNCDERIWKMPPSADRANLRSATPMGFACAVFNVNRERAAA